VWVVAALSPVNNKSTQQYTVTIMHELTTQKSLPFIIMVYDASVKIIVTTTEKLTGAG